MDTYDERLKKVIKSCETSRKVIRVAWVVFSVLTVVALATAIVIACNAHKVNNAVVENGLLDSSISGLFTYDMNVTSNIPAIQEFFEERQYGYAYSAVFSLAYFGGMFLFFTILLAMFSKIFKLINDAQTPFAEDVKKLLRSCFIFISIMLVVTASTMIAVVVVPILWCVYNIFSYGCELQRQSDETL